MVSILPAVSCDLRTTLCDVRGMQWHRWLRDRATSWKVVGLIPDGVTGIFHFSGHSMALRLTQPLREMSTRNIS